MRYSPRRQMTVGYIVDELFAEHRAPASHPECPERLLAARSALAQTQLADLARDVSIRPASADELSRVHTAAYVDRLQREVAGTSGWLDGDTYHSEQSVAAALAAAGAAVDLVQGTMAGDYSRGLALVRPPGHHAEADRAMGFCLINSAAVAAAAAVAGGANRVAVLDWDVHHGNGTQHIFYDQSSVTYLSVHQSPFYPGTGAATETGEGQGAGYTINVPLPAGCGDDEYVAVFDHVLMPELTRARAGCRHFVGRL